MRTGAVTALVGPNASGKTTLIKIVLGLTRPDGGVVRVDGVEADASGEYRRALGYMPQAARFPENLRVRDVLDLVTALRPGAGRDEELGDRLRARERDEQEGRHVVRRHAAEGERGDRVPLQARGCSSSTSPPPDSIRWRAAS